MQPANLRCQKPHPTTLSRGTASILRRAGASAAAAFLASLVDRRGVDDRARGWRHAPWPARRSIGSGEQAAAPAPCTTWAALGLGRHASRSQYCSARCRSLCRYSVFAAARFQWAADYPAGAADALHTLLNSRTGALVWCGGIDIDEHTRNPLKITVMPRRYRYRVHRHCDCQRRPAGTGRAGAGGRGALS